MDGLFENNINEEDILEKEKLKKESFSFWLTIILFGIFIFLMAVCSLIVLFIYGDKTESNEDKNKNTNPIITINQTGIIKCQYLIEDISSNIQLINKEFQNDNMITDIFINNTKISYVNNFKFSSKGNYNIEYIINGKINLKYMFKDILSLITFEIISTCDKDLIIESIEGLFENCQNLEKVKLNDMNTKNIKSISKLFYNNINLSKLDIIGINTDNITDMSYMFYNCESLKKKTFLILILC